MTVVVWRIAVEAPGYTADDLTGEGARRSGGRWNAPGTPMIYCASSIALATLETLAHVRGSPLPLNRFLVSIAIPDEIWKTRVAPARLPGGWDAVPAGLTSIRAGTNWVRNGQSAVMAVPSVIVPDENVYLLNPAHPDIRKIKATTIRKWQYDPRFF